MANTSKLSIVDTGYVSPSLAGTQLSSNLRANSGSEIELLGINITIATTGNYDNSPTLNSFSISVPNFGSIENNKVILSGVLDLNSSTDRGLMYELSRLPHTIGYKVCYMNKLDTVSQNNLITLLSNNNKFSSEQQTLFGISGAYYYINLVFLGFDISQDPRTNIISWKLQGVQIPY